MKMKFLTILVLIISFSYIGISKSENNWIQKKDKDKWIKKKEKVEWLTKKKKTEWITKKSNKNDLAYLTLLPLFIIMIYIKRRYDK